MKIKKGLLRTLQQAFFNEENGIESSNTTKKQFVS